MQIVMSIDVKPYKVQTSDSTSLKNQSGSLIIPMRISHDLLYVVFM